MYNLRILIKVFYSYNKSPFLLQKLAFFLNPTYLPTLNSINLQTYQNSNYISTYKPNIIDYAHIKLSQE